MTWMTNAYAAIRTADELRELEASTERLTKSTAEIGRRFARIQAAHQAASPPCPWPISNCIGPGCGGYERDEPLLEPRGYRDNPRRPVEIQRRPWWKIWGR